MSNRTNPPTKIAEHGTSLLPTADPLLTLAERKLAGSTQCLNCGTALKGPYCYYCGQPDRNFMRFFPALMRDLMEDFLDLDSRFMRTFKPLLFKPGCLTRDFLAGRRYRYTPPMRLYMASSIAFFLLSVSTLELDDKTDNTGRGPDLTTEKAVNATNADAAFDRLPESHQAPMNNDQKSTVKRAGDADQALFDISEFQFNDKTWNRETNPVDFKWLPDWLNDRINDEIAGSPKKAGQINDNPKLIIDKVFDILPITMFILLPVVALIFKFWYLFAKRYYIEHLIFSLHNHAFIFVSLILILLGGESGDLLATYHFTTAASIFKWLITAIGIGIPVYLLISLRTVYQQGWLLTLGKFGLIGISYTVLLGVVTVIVAIASFVLL